MSRLFLVRHGKTSGKDSVYLGHTDVPLNREGLRQAETLMFRLTPEKFTAIYSSDLSRSRKTAELISFPHNLEVSVFPELRELNFGQGEGRSFEEIRKLYPAECQSWFVSPDFALPGGESLINLAERLKSFIDLLAKASAEDRILIVSHKGVIRTLVCILIGLKLKDYWKISIDPASITIVDTYQEGAILQLLNDTSHLREK